METFIRNKTKPYSDLLFVGSGDADERTTNCAGEDQSNTRNDDASAFTSTSSLSVASRPLPLDPDFESVFRPTQMRCLALVSHNEMKAAMKTFVIANKNILKKFRLTGTNSTMSMLREVFAGDESVIFGPSCSSGPLGGDAELVALMCAGELGGMIFFQDPMSAHPHQSDIDCLCRQAIVHNVMIAGNPTSALMMMTTLRIALKEDKPELIPSFFCTLQSPSVGAYKKQQQEVILSHSQHQLEYEEQDGMLELPTAVVFPSAGTIQRSPYGDPQALAFESGTPTLVSNQSASSDEQGSLSNTIVSSRRRKGCPDNNTYTVSLRNNATISPTNHHDFVDADDEDTADTVASFSTRIASHRLVDAEEKLAISIANFVEAMATPSNSRTTKSSEVPGAGVTQHHGPSKSGAGLISKSHHSYFFRNGSQNRHHHQAKANEHDKLSSTSRSADIMTSSDSIKKIASRIDDTVITTISIARESSDDRSLPLSTRRSRSRSSSLSSYSAGETAKSAARRRSRQQQVIGEEKKSNYKPTSSRRQQQRMVTRFDGPNRKQFTVRNHPSCHV